MKALPTFAPEHELILQALRRGHDDASRARVATLVGLPLDWTRVARLVGIHGVQALFHRGLKECAVELPNHLMTELENIRRYNSIRNVQLAQELLRLEELLGSAGVRTIRYKGPMLAAQIYRNLALRQIVDLDLLVHHEDLPLANRRVLAAGYHGDAAETGFPRALGSELKYEANYWRPDLNLSLEMHWRVVSSHSEFGLDRDYLWKRASPVGPRSPGVHEFPEDLKFILLCVHNEKHDWRYLKFMTDVAWRIESAPALDFDQLMDEARRLRREKVILKTMLISSALLGAQLPESIRAVIRARNDLAGEAALSTYQLFRNGFCLPWPGEWRDALRAFVPVASNGSKPDGMKSYAAALLTPQYDDRKKFPRPLTAGMNALYMLTRILRFAKYWCYQHHVNRLQNSKAPRANVL